MKKIMLIYPSGELYQRGEDRCQINIEASTANSMRACNDLGIAAGILKKFDYDIFLKDYQSEKLSFNDLCTDVIKEAPDVIFISITNGSIYNDIKTIEVLKKIKSDVVIILKGALFFNPDISLFNNVNLSNADYLIGGETEFIIAPLLNAHFQNKSDLNNIEGICFKENENWKVNPVTHFFENLDDIPFPDRSLMNNKLYINPLTNMPMATISTSRGCPSSCVFCLSPLISGKKVRFRSCQNILREIIECVEKYNIKDFFFKSDTFTIDKQRVLELCDLIINSPLRGKINWCANSRVNTLDEETVIKMKEAGCSLIALGLESGSNDSLLKMKKGTTVEQNISAVQLIKKHGISIFGFYLIGFPWENKSHLKETEKLIFMLDTDFIEVSVVVPFIGSEVYNMLKKEGKIEEPVQGKDSFKNIMQGTKYLSKKQVEKFKKNLILRYYMRPSYMMKIFKRKKITAAFLLNCLKYGFRLIKNNL